MHFFHRSASPWRATSVLALIYTLAFISDLSSQRKGRNPNDDLIGTIIVNALIGGLVGYAFAPKGWERIPLPGVER